MTERLRTVSTRSLCRGSARAQGFIKAGRCTSNLGTKLRLAAGAEKSLCVPFQVKKKAKISAFRFRLNSSFGPETGEWAVE